jgi:hypothetical protein
MGMDMGKTLTTHGCGKSWLQRGDRTGHCGGCHVTFEGNALFDAHLRRGADGSLIHLDPAGMKFKGEPLVFDGTYGDGSWSAARTFFDPGAVWGRGGTTSAPADSDAPERTFAGVSDVAA